MTTFWRLLGFLRPYRRTVIASLVFAWLAMGMTVLIPWLVGQDGRRDRSSDRVATATPSCRWRWRSSAPRVLRLGLTVRRAGSIAGKVSLAVEFDLRERVYRHLQTLELGFFDSQQTGQLMSRATVDLQWIRFFLGYGLIFLTQNALTLLLAVGGDVRDPAVAGGAGAAAGSVRRAHRDALQPPLATGAAGGPAADRRADRRGRGVVSGIRIVKAFAREDHMLGRFQHAVTRVFDQNVFSTRLRAFYSPLLGFLPSLGLAVVLLVGGQPGDRRTI